MTNKSIDTENDIKTTEIEIDTNNTDKKDTKKLNKIKKSSFFFGKRYLINWMWDIRSLIVCSLIYGASIMYTFPRTLEDMIKEKLEKVPEFDSIPASYYKDITSYYNNKLINDSINKCYNIFNEITNLSKTKPINSYYKLNKERYLLISGEPGIGKTYCVKYIIGQLFGTRDKEENWKCIEIKPDILLNKICGKSEEIIRNMFNNIITDINSKYIIIFDECDDLIDFRGIKNNIKDNIIKEAPNFGGSLFDNILTGHFLNLINGNDDIMETPFICIFITNKSIENISKRVKRRFNVINPSLTSENIEEVFDNYLQDTSNNLDIKLTDKQKQEVCTAFSGLSVQRIIEVLNEYVEYKDKLTVESNVDDFIKYVKRDSSEKRNRHLINIFNQEEVTNI